MEEFHKRYDIQQCNYKNDENYKDIMFDVFENDNLNYSLKDGNILNILGLYYQKKNKKL